MRSRRCLILASHRAFPPPRPIVLAPFESIQAVADRLAARASVWSQPEPPANLVARTGAALGDPPTVVPASIPDLDPALGAAAVAPTALDDPAPLPDTPIATDRPSATGLISLPDARQHFPAAAPPTVPPPAGPLPQFDGADTASEQDATRRINAETPASEPVLAGETPAVPTVAGFAVSLPGDSGDPIDLGLAPKQGTSRAEPPGIPARMPTALGFTAWAAPDPVDSNSFDPFAGAEPGDPMAATLGGGAGASGGAGLDLSRTNDLLQQLLDAVRKPATGGGTSLPTGGPSVSADRS